jgi:hypothetical protein
LGKNKKSPQDERGAEVSLLKGKPGQGVNLGQKQEITQDERGAEVSLLKGKPG